MRALSSRWKAPALLAIVLAMGWVLADAFQLPIARWNPSPPTVDQLVAAGPDAVTMLRGTAKRDIDAADRLAECLLASDVGLRQVARDVTHERLDQWQLDSLAFQQQMVGRISGTLRRLLERSNSDTKLTPEAQEITTRLIQTAHQSTFTNRESCMNDCQAVLIYAEQPNEPTLTLSEGLRQAMSR